MQKRRLFLAINLPEEAKRRAERAIGPWRHLPVRWITPRNLHLTLVFIGYVTDDEMLEIANVARDAATRHRPFVMVFSRLILAPPETTKRMVWWTGEPSEPLGRLQEELMKTLWDENLLPKLEKRLYHPHITVGKIRMPFDTTQGREELAKGVILKATVPVDSFELMESDLKRGGTEYSILESFPLE